VNKGHIAALVEVAINDTCHQTNPRPCTRADFERIFAEAI
jgi:alcohol dehydrogenase class IV